MWSFLNLNCPTSELSEYRDQDKYVIDDLRNFVTVLSTAANTLTSDNPVWKEICCFHDIQVRYKRMLCCDNCLVFLQRIGHCLKKMVLLNLSKSYLDLAERFLLGFQDLSTCIHLPSRQQVEYILIRTKIAAKLVTDAIIYSRNTFCFLIQKLKMKCLIPELVMAASIIARFNMMLKVTLKQLCSVYLDILPWRKKVKRGTFKWPEKMDLPADLEKWLETFDSGLMKSFSISKADFDILSSALKVKVGSNDNDLDCVIIMDGRHQNGTITDDDNPSAQRRKQKKRTKNDPSSLKDPINTKRPKTSHIKKECYDRQTTCKKLFFSKEENPGQL